MSSLTRRTKNDAPPDSVKNKAGPDTGVNTDRKVGKKNAPPDSIKNKAGPATASNSAIKTGRSAPFVAGTALGVSTIPGFTGRMLINAPVTARDLRDLAEIIEERTRNQQKESARAAMKDAALKKEMVAKEADMAVKDAALKKEMAAKEAEKAAAEVAAINANSKAMPSINSKAMPSINSKAMPSINSTAMPSTNSTVMPSNSSGALILGGRRKTKRRGKKGGKKSRR
jgi:hypothetical protein